MTNAREREGWQLLSDMVRGKGAEVAAWLAVNDPFQDALPCFMAKGVERTGYILRIQARMDFMMGVR